LQDQTVTIRDRDTLRQWRVKVDDCTDEIGRLIENPQTAA
jgi:glycyl-tRNA synthetase